MKLFNRNPPPMAHSLRALARLIGYPDATLRAHLPQLREALHAESALGPVRLAELDALMAHIARQHTLDAEADYVQLFDSGRRTALHLFEHVHGDSRERGPALINLAQTYEAASLTLAEGEMPDHLSVVLEFASTQPPRAARDFLGEFSHILATLQQALEKRASRYASVPAALRDLAGEAAQPVQLAHAAPAQEGEEPPLDETWAEPEAFDGCASAGPGRSTAEPQPIHIVRRGEQPRPGAPA